MTLFPQFRNVPIARKLTLVILVTTIVALFLSGGAIVVYEWSTYRKQAMSELVSLAQIMSANSTGALVFNDSTTANEILATLKDDPDIVAARIYDSDGIPFATYRSPEHPNSVIPTQPQSYHQAYDLGRFKVFRPVMLQNEPVGSVYIETNIEAVMKRLWRYGGIVFLVIILLIPVVLLISFQIQKVVSKPILDLAHVAEEVVSNKNYGVRAPLHGRDEIGTLTESLNLMLETIETRERELDNSRERLEMAQIAGKICSFDWDVKADVLTWTGELQSLFGVTANEITGNYKTWVRAVHPEDIPRVEQAIKRASREKKDFYAEYRAVWPDKTVIWMAGRGRTLYSPEGELIRMVGINMDITEHKRAEQALAQQAELWRSNKDLEQFAYVSSHDLKEPLRMISSFSQLLQRKYAGKLDKDADSYLKYIVTGVSRMQRLIEDLLSFSLAGRGELKLVTLNLGDIVNETLADLRNRIQETKAEVTHSGLPVVVADTMQMRQLFQNLIGNAIKFAKDTPKISIVGRSRSNEWVIGVQDNGIGIEPQYKDEVFKIFRRLHSQEEYPGTGIGLALCKKIVERHHGRIWLESEPDKGTTFFFTLPLVRTVDVVQQASQSDYMPPEAAKKHV